ncbi:secondary thiamine-phosphate synthase enzyme YjbQ [Cohaesibacter intestini]|uniref:secondary thiamine-phosphate synthase enzyme YjbQ n=1 Tax=Cohaesibacter intestini TaxID=2211145 RepID=UPI001FDF64CC|nr:secondary thiamine-phosphate synthase enzyme YjbQ [Cohaesibacter intestini]
MPAAPNTHFDVIHDSLSFQTGAKSIQIITRPVADWLQSIGAISGTVTLFIQHTSASLTIQENADPTVQDDLLSYLEDLAPQGRHYVHSYEGPDDMPAHLKTALTSVSETIPVDHGQMLLGQWQGIYLIEHRAHRHQRQIRLCFTGLRQADSL